jgi:hypothetical protein
MTRLAPIALSAAVLLACGPALASEAPAKGAAPTGHYIEFSTLTATVLRPDRRRGVMAVDATLDIPDAALRARAVSLTPRLRAAYSQALNVYAAGLPPGRPADPDYLSREMQRQTDAAIGRPGAKFLLGSILVN